MRLFITIGSCVTLAISATAQERFGISHSNYGGADAICLNPARSAGQWPYMDIRLLGADLHAWNSLVAWTGRDQRLIGELRTGISTGTTDGEVVLRDASSDRMHRGSVQANLLGPAVSLSLGRGTIGAGIRARSNVSASGISPDLGNFIFHGLSYQPQQGIRYTEEGVRVLTAAWTEFSVNYGRILQAQGFGMLSAGATVKYSLAHAGGALSFDQLDLTVLDSTRLVVHQATVTYGLAMPAFNAGNGWGADIGISYERTIDECDGYLPHHGSGGCDPLRYRYRIGLSLIDLGSMKFREGQAGGISAGMADIEDYTDIPIDSEEDIDSLFATATQWSRDAAFNIGSPTAVALQYDQRLADHTYVALAAVQNLSGSNTTRLRRPNSIAFTPRFETRHVEVAVPIVVHEYDIRQPSVGLMLRVEGLVVGSDHALPFLTKRDIHAVDVYFRLRWMIHRSPFCKGKRKPNAAHRAGSNEPLPCATPNE